VIAADLSDCYHGEFGVLMLWPLDDPEDGPRMIPKQWRLLD
jgi:hypothetical protein